MLVPKAGLEPARLAPHAPQTCVSAIPPLRQPSVWPSLRNGAPFVLSATVREFTPGANDGLQRKRIIEVVQNACQSTSCPVKSSAC